MENKLKLKLLPPYFKFIGLGLIVAAFAPMAIIKLNHIQIPKTGKELVVLSAKSLIVLGLAFIAWSKERNEYERLMYIRIKSFLYAFFLGVFLVIFQPIGDLLLLGKADHISGPAIVAEMLLFYLMYFYLEKFGRSRKRKLKFGSNGMSDTESTISS